VITYEVIKTYPQVKSGDRNMAILCSAHPVLLADAKQLKVARETNKAAQAPLRYAYVIPPGESEPINTQCRVLAGGAYFYLRGLAPPINCRFVPVTGSRSKKPTTISEQLFTVGIGPVVSGLNPTA
jgi:hypothetical protein